MQQLNVLYVFKLIIVLTLIDLKATSFGFGLMCWKLDVTIMEEQGSPLNKDKKLCNSVFV